MQVLDDKEWRSLIKIWVKGQMKEQNIDFPELAERLKSAGITLDNKTLSNKINRTSYSSAFLMQICEALNVGMIDLTSLKSDFRSDQ